MAEMAAALAALKVTVAKSQNSPVAQAQAGAPIPASKSTSGTVENPSADTSAHMDPDTIGMEAAMEAMEMTMAAAGGSKPLATVATQPKPPAATAPERPPPANVPGVKKKNEPSADPTSAPSPTLASVLGGEGSPQDKLVRPCSVYTNRSFSSDDGQFTDSIGDSPGGEAV